MDNIYALGDATDYGPKLCTFEFFKFRILEFQKINLVHRDFLNLRLDKLALHLID